MEKSYWCETNKTHFLHGAKWTEKIIHKFEQYIHTDPEECMHIAELALTSGVVELWANDIKNPFSFLALMLTANDSTFESKTSLEQLNKELSALMNNSEISSALKASLYISYQLRNASSLCKNGIPFQWWDKEKINHEIFLHRIKYINLQGANLEKSNLSGLKLPANLRKANLSKANVSNTDLRGAYLCGALISEKQLQRAIVDHTTELPSGQHAYKPHVTTGGA